MSQRGAGGADGRGGKRRVVPAFMAASGTEAPRNTYDQMTRVRRTTSWAPHGLEPSQQRVLNLLSGGTLTLAEVASHLALPLGIARIILGDLVNRGLLETRAPVPDTDDPLSEQPPIDLLQRVLDGLIADRHRTVAAEISDR